MYEYKCHVSRIIDGDSIEASIDLGFGIMFNSKVRLYGIDTPESRTRDEDEKVRGLLAKQYLESKINSAKQVIIQTEKDAKGKFGRVLGRLFADEININQSMIDNHLAVEYFGQSKEELEAGHMANRQILIDEKKINLG
jgi:micrococcal nuclease